MKAKKKVAKKKSILPDIVIRLIAAEKAIMVLNERIDKIVAADTASKPLKGI